MLSTVLFCLLLASVTGLILVTWLWRDSLAEKPSQKNAVKNLQWKQNNSNISFTWNAPISDTFIHHYTISVTTENSVLHSVETSYTNYTFYNLNGCSNYKFLFESYFSETKSTKFKPVQRNINTSNDVPDPPNISQINLNTKLIKWVPGEKNPTCIRGYYLKVFHDKLCIKDVILSEESTYYNLSDINSCSRYLITLRAHGPLPNLTSELTMQETGSHWSDYKNKEFITNLHYEMVSWSEVRIKWDVVNDFRECIHDFVLSFYNTKGLQVFTTNEYEYLVTNLTVCSWYLVTVTSRTLHGTFIGKASEINVKTKALTPGPVSNLYVVSDAQGKKFLNWLPPEINRGCVNVYQIIQFGKNSSQQVTYTKNTYSELSLKTCEHYAFNVTSLSDNSSYGASVTLNYFYVPEGRQIDQMNFAEDNNGLIVKWRTSVLESECFELFNVEICALDHDSPCHSCKPNKKIGNYELSAHIPNIIPCTTYKISISLLDSSGQYTFISEIYRSNMKPFDKPIFKQLVNIDSHSASLKWGVPNLNNNNCPLTGNELKCVDEDNNFIILSSNLSRTTEVMNNLMNLKSYQNYICTLSFINPAGKSLKSDDVKFRTLEDVPSQPSNLSTLNVQDDKLNISWKPPSQSNGELNKYRLEVRSIRLLYKLPSWCYFKPDFVEKTIISEKQRDYEIRRLSPFTEYKVSIFAANNAGFGNPVEKILFTAPSTPCIVTEPQYISTSLLSYTITWKQPCRANGILKSFKVSVNGTRENHPNDVFSCLVLANVSYTDYVYSVKLPKLRPVYRYTVDISAMVENVTQYGDISSLEFTTPATLPPVPIYEKFTQKINTKIVPERNGTAVQLTLTKDMFDDFSGKIEYYAIILGQDISHNNKMENGLRNSLNDWPFMNNWAESYVYNFVFSYQVTPSFWNPFEGKIQNNSVVFTVGENTECQVPSTSYCNGPLKPETKYSLKIRAFTTAGYQDSPPLKFNTGSETINGARTNYLLVVCLLLLVGFMVCGLYYVKSGEIPLLVEVRNRMNGKAKLTVVSTKNIKLKNFADYYAKLRNSPHILKIEFNELNEITAKYDLTDNVAKRYDNYRKNRYVNVVPYDETRVKIHGERGDYINASFIEGYNEEKNRYIACQGPLVETFGDFWNMILQYNVAIIIMLCQIIENKKMVCEKYFPDVNQTLKFDGIKVECTMLTSTTLYEERKITVTKENKELTVCHIKFLEWPDFGTPADPETLVDFCYAIRKRYTNSPVVVHCSAGIGRTGTFIACDIMLQHLPKNNFVNIFNIVLKLRKQRPNMVQSVGQYTYLYECAFYAIAKLKTNCS